MTKLFLIIETAVRMPLLICAIMLYIILFTLFYFRKEVKSFFSKKKKEDKPSEDLPEEETAQVVHRPTTAANEMDLLEKREQEQTKEFDFKELPNENIPYEEDDILAEEEMFLNDALGRSNEEDSTFNENETINPSIVSEPELQEDYQNFISPEGDINKARRFYDFIDLSENNDNLWAQLQEKHRDKLSELRARIENIYMNK